MAKFSEYWQYRPSAVAGFITAAIFGILTVFHLFRLFKTRTWFCIPLVIGGAFEIIGFASRGIAHDKYDILIPRLLDGLLILLAPILFAATVYMILSRLIRATAAESFSIIRVKWLTKLFVGGDILCFFIQAIGGGMKSGADNAAENKKGDKIILIGLILQIIIFALFLLSALVFHKRLRARPTAKSRNAEFNWERFMVELYAASFLITFRNLFRVIEYAMGNDGYLLSREWPIYVFDALPMAIVLFICSKWYVGSIKSEKDVVDLEAMNNSHVRGH
ncbi:RTA1 like protein-domain-containing protein [Bisporella sp. PMI_857]|nr:RTA1 like protein-domain-containing protein [Bisporella sp. PMI_857]